MKDPNNHPMLCVHHGGSPACEKTNKENGYTCPKCELKNYYREDLDIIHEFMDGFDPTLNIEYFDSWSDWENWGWVIVAEKDGIYYYQDGGEGPFSGVKDKFSWEPEVVTEEQAIILILEWEENL